MRPRQLSDRGHRIFRALKEKTTKTKNNLLCKKNKLNAGKKIFSSINQLDLWQRCCEHCEMKWHWQGRLAQFHPPSACGTWRHISSSEPPGLGPDTPQLHVPQSNSRRSPEAITENLSVLLNIMNLKTMCIWHNFIESKSSMYFILSVPVCWGRPEYSVSDTWDSTLFFAVHNPCFSNPTQELVFQLCQQSIYPQPQTRYTPVTTDKIRVRSHDPLPPQTNKEINKNQCKTSKLQAYYFQDPVWT